MVAGLQRGLLCSTVFPIRSAANRTSRVGAIADALLDYETAEEFIAWVVDA